MNKNELKVLKILAEVQNPDKIIEDMAKQLVFLATERATAQDGTWTQSSVKQQVSHYLTQLHEAIDKQFL